MKEIIALIGFILSLSLLLFLLNGGVKDELEKYKIDYQKPDTSIVCKNHLCDTVITRKSLPAILK